MLVISLKIPKTKAGISPRGGGGLPNGIVTFSYHNRAATRTFPPKPKHHTDAARCSRSVVMPLGADRSSVKA